MRWTILTLAALVAACTTSPTGRTQLTLLPDAVVDQFGVSAFNDLRRSTAEVNDGFVSAYVSCVTDSIVRALPDSARSTDWQVVVFADQSANAFALPGGRIGVHDGLLRVATDQHQLATVIGHEIAHVLARHANERMSTTMVAQTGLALASEALNDKVAGPQIMAALGIGSQVGVLLPYNRSREAEADVMGLSFMAQAGFNPGASVVLWQNMAADRQGNAPPEFLSTHPSNATRIAGLSQRIPDALPAYEAARRAGRVPDCDRIRDGF